MTFNAKIPVAEVNLGPGILAFFTTSRGGRSQHPYDSMNLGSGVGDAPQDVLANREEIESAVGAGVVYLNQVHGAAVIDSDDLMNRSLAGVADGDGHTSKCNTQALAVYVADCVPVLLADPTSGIVGAAHAGRPGLESKVITATVNRMISRGARAGEIRAAVGPCICAHCYEVPTEMARKFGSITNTQVSTTRWQTTGIALREAAHKELEACGIAAIMHVDQCTYELSGPDGSLFSHRRATHTSDETGGKTGRFAGIVRLV